MSVESELVALSKAVAALSAQVAEISKRQRRIDDRLDGLSQWVMKNTKPERLSVPAVEGWAQGTGRMGVNAGNYPNHSDLPDDDDELEPVPHSFAAMKGRL